MYKIILEKQVQKFLEKHKWENIILSFLENLKILAEFPFENNLDIVPMVWLENSYRLRIWKYRFLYRIENEEICIYFFKASSRWDVYK